MKKLFATKYLLISVGFSLFTHICSAQVERAEVNVDSLATVNARYHKQDEAKLIMLIQLASGYEKSDPDKGIITGEQAIELAQKLNKQLLLAEAFNNKGLNHEAKSQFPEALELYGKALDINTGMSNKFGMATNFFNMGKASHASGENEQALGHYDKALSLFEKLNIKKELANVYDELGKIQSPNEYPIALEYFQKAFSINEQLGNKSGMAGIMIDIGNIYYYLSDYHKALEYYQNSLSIGKQLGDKIGMANNLINIGSVYGSLSNYPLALEFFQKALTINEQLGNKSNMGYILSNIGTIYNDLHDYHKALEYYQSSSALFEQVGNKEVTAKILGNIGNVYANLSDHSKALECHQSALITIEQIGDKGGAANIYNNIGSAYQYLSDSACIRLGIVPEEKYLSALEYYLKALKINEQLGDKLNMAINFGKIGNLYRDAPTSALLKIGVKPSERYTKAQKAHQESLALATEIGSLSKQTDALQNLSSTYEKQGDFTKALDAYKKHIVLRDSTEGEEVKNELTRVEMNYEFEKKQNITRVENEKEIAIRDATLKANKREKWFLFSGLLGLFIIGTMLFRIGRIRKKSNEKLVNLNSELEAANQIKMRFVAILHHDLRGPVASLIHFLHLKKNSPELFNEEAKERLELKTMTDAENLLATMEDLLLWSKGQMDNFRPHPARLTVSSLFKDIERQFSNNDRISFRFENPNNLELFSDENYLKTILRNLTSNAVKILENTESPIIIWKALGENSLTKLIITDNGRGSDESKFKALYDDSEVVGIKSGMGFHLIRDLAKAINCAISVNSKSDFGTEIVLKF